LELNADDLVTLNEEIAGMVKAGVPLDQGLAAMAREMARGRLQRATAAIAADMSRGQTLDEALQNQAGHVPPFYSSLVRAGIRSGRLAEILATLTFYARSLSVLRATVVGALFYPVIVLTVAVILFGGLAYYIVPQFGDIFRDFGLRLPALTEGVIWLAKHADVILIPILLVAAGLVSYWLATRFSERGRLVWARFLYTIPVIGTMIRATRLAAFSELLAILVDQSVPLPEAFATAGQASSDPIMAAGARQVEEDLCQGIPLNAALRNRQLVPELIAWMVGVGENRGQLGSTLHQIADLYRRQMEMRADILRHVLPPFMIIGTAGILVTMFVIALMLPVIKLLEALAR
jgi:type II secretory pathway component PulF